MKILPYKRVGVLERIDIDKTDASKEYMFCHYWHSKDEDF